jgi:carboxyl-terminal processing protease
VNYRDYFDYRESSDGELQGVGLLLSSDSRSRKVVVAAPLADSPAQRAGLRRGDVLVAIDGQPLPEGADSGEASRRLRGASGTRVSVSFNRFPGGYTPGVPSKPPNASSSTPISSTPGGLAASTPVLQTVTLERAKVNVSPVVSGKVTLRGQTIGYVRLSQFNASAATDMRAAVDSLLNEGVKGFVLDLRDNPGGMVNIGKLLLLKLVFYSFSCSPQHIFKTRLLKQGVE